MNLPSDTLSLLAWIAAGGMAGAVSLLFERAAWFKGLSAGGKVMASFAVCSLLAVLATVITQNLTPETLAAIDPSVKSVLVLAPFFINQLAHLADKKYLQP
jgi:hypothetical protein